MTLQDAAVKLRRLSVYLEDREPVRLEGDHHLVLLRRLRGGIVVGVRLAIRVSLGDVHMGLIACREPGGPASVVLS